MENVEGTTIYDVAVLPQVASPEISLSEPVGTEDCELTQLHVLDVE